jgi:hypothetical protein
MIGGLAGVEIAAGAETLGTVTRVEWHRAEEAAPQSRL